MIKIENLVKKYKENDKEDLIALDDINIELPDKGFVCLYGENGCGKTTLLNIISTLDSDYLGNVLINNLDIKKETEFLRKNVISYVFQENYFVNNLNIMDNLKIISSDEDIIESKLEEYKVLEKKESYFSKLSGGQKQRTSMIRGLIKDYEILLVDEPTSSMDDEMERYVFEHLKTISKEKLVIFVSHNVRLINLYSDLIIKIDNGKIVSNNVNSDSYDFSVKDNEITFNESINLNVLSNNDLNEMAQKYGNVIIKKDDSKSKLSELVYSNKEYNFKYEDCMDEKKKSVILKSISHSIVKPSIIFIMIFTILILISEILIDFNKFSRSKFIYSTMQGNGEEIVNVTSNAGYFTMLKFNDYRNLEEEYDTTIEYVTSLETNNSFDFFETDFYSNTLNSINRTDFKNLKIIEGKVPDTYSSYVISDYVSDALIKSNELYSSYNDIISKGILLNDYFLNVSGILDTDYEKYLGNDNSIDKNSKNLEYNIKNRYCSIYGNITSTDDKSVSIMNIPSEDFFADCVASNSVSSEAGCIVNTLFANEIGYDGTNMEFKYNGGYLYIEKVIEDENTNPTVYVTSSRFEEVINVNLENFSSININVNSYELLKFLVSKDFTLNCYSATYVYKMIDIINVVEMLFISILVIIILIIIIFLSNFLAKFIYANRILYVIYKMNGYKMKYFYKSEIIYLAFIALCSFSINIISYYGFYNLFNFILSKMFNAQISLFMNSILTLSIMLLVSLSLIMFIYSFLNRRRYNENLINYIKEEV